MEFVLWLIAVVLVVYGIVSIVRGALLFSSSSVCSWGRPG